MGSAGPLAVTGPHRCRGPGETPWANERPPPAPGKANVSAWSIRHPIPGVMLFVLLTLAGLLAFKAMKIQYFPDIDLPTVTVVASLAGASPAQLESELARQLENSIATVQGIKHLHTSLQDGTATITIEFHLEKPTGEALDDVRAAVARVRAALPAELPEPVVSKLDLAGSPILTYAIAAPGLDDEALSWFVDHTVAKALSNVRGVGAVTRVGGVTREVRVELDPTQLLALSVSAADISRQLRMTQQEAPSGRTDVGGAEQSVRTIATVKSAQALAAMDIALGDGRRVRLDQVARVSDTVAERRSEALLDGKPVVGFEITRTRGAGEVEVEDGVRRELAALTLAHPGIVVTEAFNFAKPVQQNYDGAMALLYEGALLAIGVVWLFLRDWRATLVSATALPLAIIPAFAGMYLCGFSLNGVTLLSLSLVVGVLVDDAIVEIENIMRHLGLRRSPRQAALDASAEIGLAVIATTFTLIAVFLPTAFMDGVPGKFFVEFGWTAAIAVFASLVVARVLTPMMAAAWLKAPKHPLTEPRWIGHYLRWVDSALRHRARTLGGVAVFVVAALCLAPFLPKGFIPPDDLSQTQVRIDLPPGTPFAQTLASAEAARRIVARHPDVRQVYTAIGAGHTGADPFARGGVAEVNRATLTLTLAPRDQRGGVKKQVVEQRLREALTELPGARVRVGFVASNEELALVLSGDDGDQLAAHAKRVEQELRALPGVSGVGTSNGLGRPELIVRPDFARAADLGVTSAAIADTLRIATAGDRDQSLAKLNLSQRQVPIVVKLPAEARTDLDLLARLVVPGSRGPVILGNVAELSIDSGPARIDRFERRRNITFELELDRISLGDAQTLALAVPSLRTLPPGLAVSPVGDAEAMSELFHSFGFAMATGVLCIYVVLVLLFRDFLQPVTILAALALSVPGALLALFVADSALSMPSLIGLIMLMGIATKNSILLVEYAMVAQREHGLPRAEAVLDACRKRARPIVMTTLAMGAGMLPVALGLGNDPSFRAPMAVPVLGGLLTSTVLSLVVIPVLFTLVDDVVGWLRGKATRGASSARVARPI